MTSRPPSGTLDAGLAGAAYRLVGRSLGVVAGERVVIVYDEARDEIAAAMADAVRLHKSEPLLFRLETLGARPHARLDERIEDAIPGAQASVLAIDFHPGELRMRTALVELATRHGLRHGHMVGVGREAILAGCSSGAGTDLTIGIARGAAGWSSARPSRRASA